MAEAKPAGLAGSDVSAGVLEECCLGFGRRTGEEKWRVEKNGRVYEIHIMIAYCRIFLKLKFERLLRAYLVILHQVQIAFLLTSINHFGSL